MNKAKNFIIKNLYAIRAVKKPMAFLFAAVLLVSIAVISYYIFRDEKPVDIRRNEQQEVLGQEKTKIDEFRVAEKSCKDGSRQGYVQISGSVVRPQWLDLAVPLSIISDNEIYPVSAEGKFCVFALKKTSFLNVFQGKETEKPIMIYALAGNKDKEIIIDSYSTAVALIFQGTRSMWQGSVLEESITAFSFIQQDENTQKLANAIAEKADFVAKDITAKNSAAAEAYQRAISSIESRIYGELPDDADLSFVALISPVDFYRDSENEYLITGKVDSLEKLSQQLLLQSDMTKNLRVGSQIGIFVDAGKIPPPMDRLNVGYNEKQVRITAKFDKAKGQFVAEDLSVL